MTIRSRARVLRVGPLPDETLEAAVRAALERDGLKADAAALRLAITLAQGSVRRALELVSGEGIQLYDQILANFDAFPALDGAALHKEVERLSGAGETERLELYLALLLGIIERLIRAAAMGEGVGERERELAMRLVSKDNLPHWAAAWETISEARAEAFALNLDRSLLVLDTWFALQQLVQEHPVEGRA